MVNFSSRFINIDLTLTSRFKLHLRPRTTSSAHVTEDIPPLPKGKTAVGVFADFLRYMYSCARTYFTESNYNGEERWIKLESNAEFVLSHPNGWEGAQQGMMREAAIMAGLIPNDANGRARLFFVTEGEASLHFCIKKGLMTKATKVCILLAEQAPPTYSTSLRLVRVL